MVNATALWLGACFSYNSQNSKCCNEWSTLVRKSDEINADINTASTRNHPIHYLDAPEPHWFCENMDKLPRKPGDGPKWICAFELLKGVTGKDNNALVLSFGSNGNDMFERSVHDHFRTDVAILQLYNLQ